ncbi:MAG: hypothetical protein RJA09_870 [Pseudomonadota bacterium]
MPKDTPLPHKPHPPKRPGLVAVLGGLVLGCTGASATPTVENTMAQRLQACTACHGEQGRAAPDGYHPRLAGKPAGYLYNQLRHFQEGRRAYGPMDQLLSTLSDSYLRDIAQHYAELRVPYPPPAPVNASAEVLQRGRTLALVGDPSRELPACASCHGSQLLGRLPAVPGLLGLPRDYINGQLGAWREGQRRAHAPDCMRTVADRMAPADIAAVSAWLASQVVPTPAVPETARASPDGRCGLAAHRSEGRSVP